VQICKNLADFQDRIINKTFAHTKCFQVHLTIFLSIKYIIIWTNNAITVILTRKYLFKNMCKVFLLQ